MANLFPTQYMLHVFRSNHHCFWKFHKFHLKTPELESLFLIKMMELYKDICSAWISRTSAQIFSRRLMSYMSQKYSRYIAILWRTILWIFRKWYMKTPKKKFISQQTYLYRSQTFWSFMKFYFVHILKVCFVFKKNSHYAYIPLYMHKTLPTLGNEKEQ